MCCVAGGLRPAAEAHFVRHRDGRWPMRGPFLVLALPVCMAACANTAGSNGGVAPQRPKVTRGFAECQAERERALGDTVPVGVTPPQPQEIVLPPAPRPSYLIGQTVSIWFLVDDRGRVLRDREVPSLGADSGYAARFRDRLHRYRFLPGVLDGCAVPAWYVLRIIL